MFDKKQKSCVKPIHLVTDDALYDRNAFYEVKIVFIHSLYKKNMLQEILIHLIEIITT